MIAESAQRAIRAPWRSESCVVAQGNEIDDFPTIVWFFAVERLFDALGRQPCLLRTVTSLRR